MKFYAALAGTDEQLATVAALRDGSTALEGLTVDTDLAWELLIALAAGGKAGNAEIDAALADDNTANGAQFAAQARASIPTLDGKQAAWDSVFGSDALPNTIVRFTGIGFQRAADKGVLVGAVQPGSPAAKAGVEGGGTQVVVAGQSYQIGGDMIVAIDGKDVSSVDELRAAIAAQDPGDTVRVTVVHADGERATLTVKLGRVPDTAG